MSLVKYVSEATNTSFNLVNLVIVIFILKVRKGTYFYRLKEV